MTTITAQLRSCDLSKDKQAQLADEAGINATVFYGLDSVCLQVNSVGHVVLTYHHAIDGGPHKAIFMGFIPKIAATTELAWLTDDAKVRVEG